MSFNPVAWFWTVGTDTSRAWSSAAAAYVAADDPAYQAFVGAGLAPCRVATEADLANAMAALCPSQMGALQTVDRQASALIAESTVAVTSTSVPALSGTFAIGPMAVANLTAIQAAISAGVGLPGGGTTVAYVDVLGADHLFTAPQFTAFAATIANYVYALTRCAYGRSDTLPSASLTIP